MIPEYHLPAYLEANLMPDPDASLRTERYEKLPASCREHDPRTLEVARRIAALIRSRLGDVEVEHIGSTSVPGCAGKGVVDLMLLYPEGQLTAARDALDALGFQRQCSRDPWPEERPMRTGSIVFDDVRFLLHVHVIAACSPEVQVLRSFRDKLRADPALVAECQASHYRGWMYRRRRLLDPEGSLRQPGNGFARRATGKCMRISAK